MNIPLFDKFQALVVEHYNPKHMPLTNYPRGDWVDDETFISIAEGYLTWLDKNLERLVDNVTAIYEATGYESGYSALTENLLWKREIIIDHPERAYSRESIKGNILEKSLSPLYHLYQNKAWGKREKSERFGFTGSLVTSSLNVEVEESVRRGKMDVSYSFHISMSIGSTHRGVIEIAE